MCASTVDWGEVRSLEPDKESWVVLCFCSRWSEGADVQLSGLLHWLDDAEGAAEDVLVECGKSTDAQEAVEGNVVLHFVSVVVGFSGHCAVVCVEFAVELNCGAGHEHGAEEDTHGIVHRMSVEKPQ